MLFVSECDCTEERRSVQPPGWREWNCDVSSSTSPSLTEHRRQIRPHANYPRQTGKHSWSTRQNCRIIRNVLAELPRKCFHWVIAQIWYVISALEVSLINIRSTYLFIYLFIYLLT